MNKKQIILGIILSLCLHGILLSIPKSTELMKKDELTKTQMKRNVEPQITAILPQEIKKDEEKRIEVAKLKEEVPKTTKVEKPVTLPTPSLKELFKPPVVENVATDEKQGDVLTGEKKKNSDYIPELKIDISDSETIFEAANFFGMKIVAIDSGNNILCEIKVNSPVQLVPFNGSLLDYSNRVRLLPDNYLGATIASFLKEKGAKLFIFIPAPVDLMFVNLQKEAVAKEGIILSQVRATAGQFVKDKEGKYSLLITDVITK